jgi:hypothetical protein
MLPTKNISQELRKAGRRVRVSESVIEALRCSQFCGLYPTLQFLDSWVHFPRHFYEAGPEGGERQNAEGLRLFPHETDRPRIPSRVHARVDAETNARARRVRREIHDRLPERISWELVQSREAFACSGASVAELFWRERVAAISGMAAQRLDSSRRPPRLVSMVLPILLRPPQPGRLTADWPLARRSAPRGAIEKTL